MATTALLAVRPFKTFAKASSGMYGFDNTNKVIFLHAGHVGHHEMNNYITDVKNSTGSIVVLHAGTSVKTSAAQLNYDASLSCNNPVASESNTYRIIYKNDIKIGIIGANKEDRDIVNSINTLAAYLKKEKKCHMVVCLSQLGYKNGNNPDDITLAEKSLNLDMIIGGDTKNFHQHPVILLNSNNEEVIIHSATGDAPVFGKIDIDFNELGQKKHICFAN